jgi:hypothetical protein
MPEPMWKYLSVHYMAFFEGSQASPVCPFDKSSIKMMGMDQWWNDTDRGKLSLEQWWNDTDSGVRSSGGMVLTGEN